MNNSERNQIKCQEWVVRFDGQIKQSEKLINIEEYHKNLNNLLKEKD